MNIDKLTQSIEKLSLEDQAEAWAMASDLSLLTNTRDMQKRVQHSSLSPDDKTKAMNAIVSA